MADSAQNRHLPASARKIEKAREDGQVARSRDLGHFAAVAGGGMLLAVQATSALEGLHLPVDVPIVLEISPDLRVLGFALALSLATGLIFGLAPAMRASRSDIVARLRDGTSGAGEAAKRRVLGNALIVGQLALSLVLLVPAGLLLRALDHGAKTNPGFDPGKVSLGRGRVGRRRSWARARWQCSCSGPGSAPRFPVRWWRWLRRRWRS